MELWSETRSRIGTGEWVLSSSKGSELGMVEVGVGEAGVLSESFMEVGIPPIWWKELQCKGHFIIN